MALHRVAPTCRYHRIAATRLAPVYGVAPTRRCAVAAGVWCCRKKSSVSSCVSRVAATRSVYRLPLT